MKITVVGAGGNVGSAAALTVAQRDFANEVVLVDIERKEGEKKPSTHPKAGRSTSGRHHPYMDLIPVLRVRLTLKTQPIQTSV